jgi:prephenate dehydratase
MKTVAILGPIGTFSHQAFVDNFDGHSPLIQDTIRDVFETIKNDKADYGLVPIENSIGGTVGMTLDCLLNFKLNIIREIILPIKHYLAGREEKLSKIDTLYCHSQTYSQCEIFIRKNLSKAKIITTVSNADSAKKLLDDKSKFSAALIPKISAMIYGLPIIKSNVQDFEHNSTKFIVISKEKPKLSNKDRTTISVHPTTDRPGLLYHILGYFANNKINLSKIESRPSKGKLGDYIFFIDFEGNTSQQNVKEALNKLSKDADVVIFGSYHREY